MATYGPVWQIKVPRTSSNRAGLHPQFILSYGSSLRGSRQKVGRREGKLKEIPSCKMEPPTSSEKPLSGGKRNRVKSREQPTRGMPVSNCWSLEMHEDPWQAIWISHYQNLETQQEAEKIPLRYFGPLCSCPPKAKAERDLHAQKKARLKKKENSPATQ